MRNLEGLRPEVYLHAQGGDDHVERYGINGNAPRLADWPLVQSPVERAQAQRGTTASIGIGAAGG